MKNVAGILRNLDHDYAEKKDYKAQIYEFLLMVRQRDPRCLLEELLAI